LLQELGKFIEFHIRKYLHVSQAKNFLVGHQGKGFLHSAQFNFPPNLTGGFFKLLNSSYRTYLISIGIVDKQCEEPACLMVKNGRASAVTVLRTPDLEKAFTSDLLA